jgi:hypothetical protein
MIGSRKNAIALAEFYFDGETADFDGWQNLGSGISRTAWLAPDGVVYKYGEPSANKAEVRNSRRLQRDGMRAFLEQHNLYIPKTSLYTVPESLRGPYSEEYIVAMEYIKPTRRRFTCRSMTFKWNPETGYTYPYKCDCARRGRPVCPKDVDKFLQSVGIADCHSGNILINSDGRYCVIDIAV